LVSSPQAERKAVNKYYPPAWTPDQVLAHLSHELWITTVMG